MLLPAPVRTYDAVRARIDAALGEGRMSPREAAALLHGADQAVWVLDNLLACLFEDRFHIWDQGFVQGDVDGPAAVAAIAEAAREVDPLVADLLRWTARWPKTRGVALTSVVPEPWARVAPAARAFLFAVAERWPDGVDPVALPTPAPWTRAELPPAEASPRFPTVSVGFTAAGNGCPVQVPPGEQNPTQVFRAALFALWQAGAPDAALEAFWRAFFERDADEVAVLCEYVSFDGDGGDAARLDALRAALHPVHPLVAWLGVERLDFPSVVWLPAGQLDEAEKRLGGWYGVRLDPANVALSARSALRRDPDALLVPGDAVQEGDVALLQAGAETGHLLIISGESTASAALVKTLREFGTPVVDRRLAT